MHKTDTIVKNSVFNKKLSKNTKLKKKLPQLKKDIPNLYYGFSGAKLFTVTQCTTSKFSMEAGQREAGKRTWKKKFCANNLISPAYDLLSCAVVHIIYCSAGTNYHLVPIRS